MRIHSIQIRNFGPFSILKKTRLGPLATIVGQNDVGKSCILKALALFFSSRPQLDLNDIHDRAKLEDDVVIEIEFTDLPDVIELEDNVLTTLQEENVLNSEGFLQIRRVFPRATSKPHFVLVTRDFIDKQCAGLVVLKEKDLNARCEEFGIDVSKSGRSHTNKGKRKAIRDYAIGQSVELTEHELEVSSDLWKRLALHLPHFEIFETDTKLNVGETTFQNKFNAIIENATRHEAVSSTRDAFMDAIDGAIQNEVDSIYEILSIHTDAFTGLTVRPKFSWEKAVTFEILGTDHDDVATSLDRRGSGMRRLLMVAFFQYMAERENQGSTSFVFAVEEPENCLHPRLQRELVKSFSQLAEAGYQIIVTTHSPVFVGASPTEDLALITRQKGVACATQAPDLVLPDVAEELGVEPSDLITGYRACVFVEGTDDVNFWKTVAEKLQAEGKISTDFDKAGVGFVPLGGKDNLKYWVSIRALHRLNRRFGVIIDSDRKATHHSIPERKQKWKKQCEADGGVFFISRKREIENYIHQDALTRNGLSLKPYDDFSDMKALFGPNVCKVVEKMTCAELLEMDQYEVDGVEHHELLEIVETLLNLAVE